MRNAHSAVRTGGGTWNLPQQERFLQTATHKGHSMNTRPAQVQERQPGLQTEMRPGPQVMPRFPGSGRLAGKTAVVTGGDSGIGQAVAVLFAREGANVAILYLDETEDARKTAQMVRDEGGECLPIAGDVGDEQFCRKAVQQVV